jgi:hypothetical protein
MRAALVAVVLTGVALGPAMAAGDHDRSASAASAFAKTGKERLTDKGSDEQRVDDCKVPLSKQTRPRPTACPWEVEARIGEIVSMSGKREIVRRGQDRNPAPGVH